MASLGHEKTLLLEDKGRPNEQARPDRQRNADRPVLRRRRAGVGAGHRALRARLSFRRQYKGWS